MKKLLQLIVIIITFYSCSKSAESSSPVNNTSLHSNSTDTTNNSNNNSDSTTNNNCLDSSHWTFKGISYCGVITTNDTTNIGVVKDVLKSADGVSDSMSITFWSDPLVSSTFIVNNGTLPTPQTGTCTILVNHGNDLYVSTGGNIGDIVNVTIYGDTLKASFSNIMVMKHDTSYVVETVSGTLTKE